MFTKVFAKFTSKPLILMLGLLLLLPIVVYAATITVIVPIDDGNAFLPLLGSCTGFYPNERSYGLQEFSVDQSGMYSFEVLSPGLALMVYDDSFDPGDPFVNCLLNDTVGSVELEAQTRYILVGRTIGFPGTGDVTIGISGPGYICLNSSHCNRGLAQGGGAEPPANPPGGDPPAGPPSDPGGTVPDNPAQGGDSNSHACDDNPANAHRPNNAPPCRGG